MPVLARVYGIPPKDQDHLKPPQFRAIQDDYRQELERQEVT